MNIRLSKTQKVKISDAADIYMVMQQILLRQQRIDRNREHFWTVGLATDQSILFIELVSMGTINHVLVEPMEVFSFALQKRAVKLILVHNHPSGKLKASNEDMDITDRLIQTGIIVNLPVIEHLIITETTYYSFAETGLLEKLKLSTKYVPPYVLAERKRMEGMKQGEEKGQKNKAKEMARAMKQKGYDVKEIAELTGLSQTVIKKIE